MLTLYISCELIEDYIHSQIKLLKKYNSELNFQKPDNLKFEISKNLLGCAGHNSLCVTDVLWQEETKLLLENFNAGLILPYKVVAKIYLIEVSKDNDTQKGEGGNLLKRVYFNRPQCNVVIELKAEEVMVVMYSRRQFEQSVLIKISSDHSSGVVNFINNSLHTRNEFIKLKRDWSKEYDIEFNCLFKLMHLMALKILFYFSNIKSAFSSFIPRLPSIPIIGTPSVLVEIKHRFHHLSTRSSLSLHHKFNQLIFIDLLWKHLIDHLLGIIILVIFFTKVDFESLAQSLVSVAERVGDELEDILDWLEGAPAGLKLNRPLSLLLSKFFKHHVLLWKAYLSLLQPVWVGILKMASLCGVFGASMQVSLVLDLLSTTTLHVYCFYVYAARLYFYQLKALRYLWRVLRGKRWNSKEGRVDDGVFNIDAMFLSTLSFSILLFLLPTTILFYAVFTALRLCTLCVHMLVGVLVSCVHKNPSYWMLLGLLRPHTLAGKVEMKLMDDSGCALVSVQLVRSSLSEIIKLTSIQTSSSSSSPPPPSSLPSSSSPLSSQPSSSPSSLPPPPSSLPSSSSPPSSSPPSSSNGFRSLVSKILVGELIFPWVEKNS